MEIRWRWLRWMWGGLVGTAVLVIMLILSGVFDPKPAGPLLWERELFSRTIPARTRQIIWLDESLPDPPYSLRLTAAQPSGAADIIYGLALGRDDDFLAVNISALGYAGVWGQSPTASLQLFPFQPWPHVRPGTNEIWLDVEQERVVVRINREILWQGEVMSRGGVIGLMMESRGETAVLDFQTLQLFAEQNR